MLAKTGEKSSTINQFLGGKKNSIISSYSEYLFLLKDTDRL